MQSRLLTIREQWILLGVAVAIALGAAVLIWRGRSAPGPAADVFPVESVASARSPVATPSSPPEKPNPEPAELIGVGVIGAVQTPGLYYFPQGARVQDLLDAAGGTLPECDLSDINRTALLVDETTLLVPWLVSDGRATYSQPAITHNPAPYTRSSWYRPVQPAAGAVPATEGFTAGTNAVPPATGMARININTASQSELEGLPGIGPVTAAKIIAYRRQQPFRQPEDLQNVNGIGPAKMNAVRDLITVQ